MGGERQRYYLATNGAGGEREFFWTAQAILDAGAAGTPQAQALERAMEYAQSEGGFGAILVMERRRLNDYVGPPIWSAPTVIEEV